jgi:hypothetical protein
MFILLLHSKNGITCRILLTPAFRSGKIDSQYNMGFSPIFSCGFNMEIYPGCSITGAIIGILIYKLLL